MHMHTDADFQVVHWEGEACHPATQIRPLLCAFLSWRQKPKLRLRNQLRYMCQLVEVVRNGEDGFLILSQTASVGEFPHLVHLMHS